MDKVAVFFENAKSSFQKREVKLSLTPDKYKKERINGVDVYFDKTLTVVDDAQSFKKAVDILRKTISTAFNTRLKGVVPIRKAKVVVCDLTPNSGYRRGSASIGEYHKGIMYIDEYHINSVDLFTHEYAHYISDNINRGVRDKLKLAYETMLNDYYKAATSTKRINLKDQIKDSKNVRSLKLNERTAIAKALGLNSQYAFNDFDEFFAEIITQWSKMKANNITYKFKTAVKGAIARI